MVIKGGARAGADKLAAHLQRLDTNERAEVKQLRGVAAQDLDGALDEMEAVALGSRCKRHFYHASINTRADELLTPEQWTKAVDRLEKELGLDDQPRAVVFHLKEGRAHVHVVWSRIDLETMTAIPDSHNYRRHEIVARELEREFGHNPVQGVHVERDGQPRPDRTPSHAEIQQGNRGRVPPELATATLSAIWQQADSGKAFMSALEGEGWHLARGDRRDFVAIDPHGGIHSLSRRIEGVRAADVRTKFQDLDPANLPTVAETKAVVLAASTVENAPPEYDPVSVVSESRLAAVLSDGVVPSGKSPSLENNADGRAKDQQETGGAVALKAEDAVSSTLGMAGIASRDVLPSEEINVGISTKDDMKPGSAADLVAGVVAKAAEVMGDIAGGIAGIFAPEGPPTPEAIETRIDKAERIKAEQPRIEAMTKAEQEEAQRLAAIQKAQADMEAALRDDDDRDRDDWGYERSR